MRIFPVLILFVMSSPTALSCGYYSEHYDEPTTELERGLKESIAEDQGKKTKSEIGYYLALREFARMRQAQKRFPEANQLYRRAVKEVTFASHVPESTVSDIWLSAADYWRRTGRDDVSLKILGDLTRLNRNVIAQSELLLPDDVGRSVAYLALSAQMQAEILQKQKGADQAAQFWRTERNFFEQIGKGDFVDEKVAVIHLPKDLGVPSSNDGFTLLPIPVDPQCFHTRPYRGRILAKDNAGKWTLHPQYRAMRELAKRPVAQH